VELKDVLKFECKSLLGRIFSKKIRNPKKKLIHIGCGENIIKDFENLDFYHVRFWKARHVQHDLRYRLPYEDSVFEGAFSEHALEHLYLKDGRFLLKEIYRVLSKESFFRCVVPDLSLYVNNYMGNPPNKEFERYDSGCDAFNSLAHNWGHLTIWDESTLKKEISKAGFDEVKICRFGEGANPNLVQDLLSRRWESIYVEGLKKS
jgi:ubiquinone/menaquinone biosynthesis C-methylase UbiE